MGMGLRRHRRITRATSHLAVVCIVVGMMLVGCGGRPIPVPTAIVLPSPPDPLMLAITQVEGEREEATGRAAVVEVPPELRHYSDTRKFLAVQLAEARKLSYEAPRDFFELVELIRAGRLVEMQQLGGDYLLYGVGESATDALFTHYDPAIGKDIPLYSSHAEFQKEFDQWTATLRHLRERVAEIGKSLRTTNRRDRARRKALIDELRASRKSATELEQSSKMIESFYARPAKSKQLLSEYQALAELAHDFGGRSYDLSSGNDRRSLKIRLLSFIRPEARAVLLDLSRSYKQKFDRPLPITSMMRTGDYQRHLRLTNKNAATVAIPPHTTGLAFDVYDYYMSGSEQQFLMAEIARMKAEGRIEALRERRNHIHVFAFADGRRPDDESIDAEVAKRKRAGK